MLYTIAKDCKLEPLYGHIGYANQLWKLELVELVIYKV
jgi:hypothetical protein